MKKAALFLLADKKCLSVFCHLTTFEVTKKKKAELVSSENRPLTVKYGHVHNPNREQLEAQMSPSQGTWLQTLILYTSNGLSLAAGGCDVPSCMRDATTFRLSEGLDEFSTAGSNV